MHSKVLAHLQAMPIVAILRGVAPDDVVPVARAICDAGITLIEVPLNSLRSLDSIDRLVQALGDRAICGAGTVLTAEQVSQVGAVGGQMIVSPNGDPEVIQAAQAQGMVSLPGVATPTEAFAAIKAGARWLKLFPGGCLGDQYAKNLKVVLPEEVILLAVGGISTHNMAAHWRAGVRGFGIGSELYRPGDPVEQVAAKAGMLADEARILLGQYNNDDLPQQ